ncbi:MAG: DUF1566 domain-containing protein [Alphaproteobacteria bacterium]
MNGPGRFSAALVFAALALVPTVAHAQGSAAGAFTGLGIVAKDDGKPSKDFFTVRGRIDSSADVVSDGVANGATISIFETSSPGSAFLGYDEIDSLTFDASECRSASAGLSLYCKDATTGSYLRLRGAGSNPGSWRVVAAVRGREFDPGKPFGPPLAAELSVGTSEWLTVTASCRTSQNATRYTCTGEGELCPVVVSNGKGGTYTSNCNGTVTDSTTGLVWEKKTGTLGFNPEVCGAPPNSLAGTGVVPRADGSQGDKPSGSCNDPHDVNNTYSWTAAAGATWPFDGNAATLFLSRLNTAPCFANHCDWRLPTVQELSGRTNAGAASGGIVAPAADPPTIAAIFGPTQYLGGYWTSTTDPALAESAWMTDFNSAIVFGGYKLSPGFVRAVRTGP